MTPSANSRQAETKKCAQCQKPFPINPEDIDFYQKMKVPAPTWCPDCRSARRLLFRNERSWHKRTCDATGKSILSMFAPDKKYKVYDQSYWKSDAWDPMEYAREYDLTKHFFPQFQELFEAVPQQNLIQKNNVGSDYTNCTLNLKNCYLCASVDGGEDSAYCFAAVLRVKSSLDIHLSTDTESSYELVDCNKSSNLRFSQSCEGCLNSWFLYDCRNCSDCVGCVGLRGKSYCIFNQQYTKEEYNRRLASLKLSSYKGTEAVRMEFEKLKLQVPRKFASIIKSEDAVGEDIVGSNNVQGFSIKQGSENVRYSYRVINSSDIWDSFTAWNGAEMEYETMSCSAQRVAFSVYIWGGFDVQYSYGCYDCNNVFGCVALRNKSYCILNKQYTKEEYEALLPKIIEQMKRAGEYGEFFPPKIAPFAYNETLSQDYFPLDKGTATKLGYGWREHTAKTHMTTMKAAELPDEIGEVPDAVLNEVIACQHAETNCNEQCAGAFKLIPMELQYYRRWGIPLPRLCPSCRHFQRVKQKPPLKLFSGTCRCNIVQHPHGGAGCKNTFATPYAPERPERIFCETCYNAEIA